MCSSDAEPGGECNVGGGKKSVLRSLESRSVSGDSSSFDRKNMVSSQF